MVVVDALKEDVKIRGARQRALVTSYVWREHR
jgi:hypothetical protein